jgi:hypothetical protein
LLYQGIEWQNLPEALSLFSFWSGKGSNGFLPAPESLFMAGSFVTPHESGRLHYNLQRVVVVHNQRDALQLTLIARGRPRSTEDRDILSWMDIGREWVVRGFADLTTEKAHKIWGKRQ